MKKNEEKRKYKERKRKRSFINRSFEQIERTT